MSVTVRFDNFSDLFGFTMYGRRFLDEPDEVIRAIDDFFDGANFDFYSSYNPDNVYINSFRELSNREVLVYITKMLDDDDYIALEEKGELEEYILKNEYEIIELLNSKYIYLHWEYDAWYVLE